MEHYQNDIDKRFDQNSRKNIRQEKDGEIASNMEAKLLLSAEFSYAVFGMLFAIENLSRSLGNLGLKLRDLLLNEYAGRDL